MAANRNQNLLKFGYSDIAASAVAVSPQKDSLAVVARHIQLVAHSRMGQYSILRNISLEIKQGDVQLLMGPSGSGKTTLLMILSGLLTPTAGCVNLLGTEITKLSRSQLSQFRLRHIGFIAQDYNLFPALTVAENVAFALALKGIRGQSAQRQTQELLEQVGLELQAHLRPRDLSGGQKQRVAIARALAGNPSLIMADEPTAALDSENGQLVITLLRRLAHEHNCTVLMVTHDQRMRQTADRVMYLEDGQRIEVQA